MAISFYSVNCDLFARKTLHENNQLEIPTKKYKMDNNKMKSKREAENGNS